MGQETPHPNLLAGPNTLSWWGAETSAWTTAEHAHKHLCVLHLCHTHAWHSVEWCVLHMGLFTATATRMSSNVNRLPPPALEGRGWGGRGAGRGGQGEGGSNSNSSSRSSAVGLAFLCVGQVCSNRMGNCLPTAAAHPCFYLCCCCCGLHPPSRSTRTRVCTPATQKPASTHSLAAGLGVDACGCALAKLCQAAGYLVAMHLIYLLAADDGHRPLLPRGACAGGPRRHQGQRSAAGASTSCWRRRAGELHRNCC